MYIISGIFAKFVRMKLLLTLLLAAALGPQDTLGKASALYSLEDGKALSAEEAVRADGIYGEWKTSVTEDPQAITFVRFHPAKYAITVVDAQQQMADSTSALSRSIGAVAGINGSYFNVKQLTPVTFIKDDGVVTGRTTEGELFRTNGSVFIATETFSIDSTAANPAPTDRWWEVMTSGPILLDEDVTVTYSEGIPYWKGFYNKRHPRSAIGLDKEGYIWLVVVDGRSEGNAEGMTIAELTDLMREMGLSDALNLDGGGSSTLWTLPGGVLNHPTDNRRFDHAGQRKVPNILAVTRR